MITAMPRIALGVRDFDAAMATFRDLFGMRVVDLSSMTVPSLGAHVGMGVPPGGSTIELMAPSTDGTPLSDTISRFLERRGEGLYALMLEAADPDLEAAGLQARGLDVMPLMPGAGGRDVHPKSTHGVLVRVYPINSAGDLGVPESSEPGLSGIVRVIVATSDADKARRAYGDGFGLAVDEPVDDPDRGVVSVVCRPPQGGVIELVSPVDTSKPFAAAIAGALDERGEGMYALVLSTADAPHAISVLTERGLSFGGAAGNETIVYGARFVIEQT